MRSDVEQIAIVGSSAFDMIRASADASVGAKH
jgi:hypothetical protein